MAQRTETVKIYAQRRWSWGRIMAVSMLGIIFLVVMIAGAIIGYRDPNVANAYLNDNLSRAIAVFAGTVSAPYLLLLQTLVTLQAVGRWPVLVLFERDGVRHVASWLGSHRLSKYRLALTSKGRFRVFDVSADPFKRQRVGIRVGPKSIQVQSYGDISEEDLAVVKEWVERGVRE